MPSMDNELLRKVSQLNNLFTEIQSYKREHPEQRLGYYEQSIGSILNAYREGDLSFDEAVAAINNTRATPSPVVDESTYPLCPVCPKCQQGYICEHCGDALTSTPAQGWQSIDSQQVYKWLGVWRDKIPSKAVTELQDLLEEQTK